MTVPLEDSIQMYHEAMEEAKVRLATVSSLTESMIQNQTSPFNAEYASLHLRFVCELIALGSMMINDPTKFIAKHGVYQADSILKAVISENPDAYPRAVTFDRGDGEIERFDWNPAADLSEHDFRRRYGKLGNDLHRHTMRGILRRKNKIYDVKALRDFSVRLATWLSQHAILIDGSNDVMLVDMFGGPNNSVRILRGCAGGI